MEYVAIKSFTDKFTGEKYTVGDRYPHRGFVKENRADELLGTRNKRGEPLIKAKEDKKVVSEDKTQKAYTKTEINKMNKSELLNLAEKLSIEGSGEMNGSELKDSIISYYGL